MEYTKTQAIARVGWSKMDVFDAGSAKFLLKYSDTIQGQIDREVGYTAEGGVYLCTLGPYDDKAAVDKAFDDIKRRKAEAKACLL